jgi:hypothetical protein
MLVCLIVRKQPAGVDSSIHEVVPKPLSMTMRSRRLTELPVCLVAVPPSIQLLIVIVEM